MPSEYEIHLLRLYIRPGGWHLCCCEIQNFDTGNSWRLLALSYNKPTGVRLSLFM